MKRIAIFGAIASMMMGSTPTPTVKREEKPSRGRSKRVKREFKLFGGVLNYATQDIHITPKGCKTYYFLDGSIVMKSNRGDKLHDVDHQFSCKAINDKNAIRKYDKFVQSLANDSLIS